MTQQVNVHEAKTHLSRLIEAAVEGQDVVIARAGTPVARLVAIDPPRRELGFLAGVWPDLPPEHPVWEPMSDAELREWDGGSPTDPLNSPADPA